MREGRGGTEREGKRSRERKEESACEATKNEGCAELISREKRARCSKRASGIEKRKKRRDERREKIASER